MAMNLEAVLKIAAQVTGLQNITALEKGLQGAEKAASSAKQGLKAVVDSSAWQAAAGAAAGLAAAIGLSVKAAMGFESSIAEVRKVVDGLDTPQGIKELKAEIIELSNQMPITAQGFADIYEAAGASGIARQSLREFAVLVAQVAVGFKMTAEEAGTALSRLKASLGMSIPEVRELADMMNYLDANTGASARQLVEFMNRSGATGSIAGLSAGQTAAFGAALMQAGAQADVAATTFNNMIKALSAGPSMTERQVSALGRLGYAVVEAGTKEKELTMAVERESQRRISQYREETDQALKELGRRYRDELQQLEDGWDDQDRAYEKSLRRRAEAQIRSIQEDESRSEESKRAAIESINDQLDQELRSYQRAQRDRRQAVKDRIEDEKDLETKGLNDRYKTLEEVEKERAEEAKDAAKKNAQGMADAWKQGFADRMQKDAIGTIKEVLTRIAGLPKAMQQSVIRDLFGDETRALSPLINNLKEFDRVMALSNGKTKAAGSLLREYVIQSQTTANRAQLAKNNIQNLAIVFGESFLPAVVGVMNAVAPLIKGFGWLLQNVPILGPALGIIAAAFIGLTAALPVIASLIFTCQALGITLATVAGGITVVQVAFAAMTSAVIPILAGLATVIQVAFAAVASAIMSALGGVLTWIGSTLIPGLLAFFSGPVGWTVLAVAAVVAMAIAFREPIMNFFKWLWDWGEPIRKFWVDLWDKTKQLAADAFKALMDIAYRVWVKPWVDLWENALRKPVTSAWNWIQDGAREGLNSLKELAYRLWVKPWVEAWEAIKGPVRSSLDFIKGIIEWFAKAAWAIVDTLFLTPFKAAWAAIEELVRDALDGIRDLASSVWKAIANAFERYVSGPIGKAWNALIGAIQNLLNRARTEILKAWDAIGGAFNTYIAKPVGSVWNALMDAIGRAVTTVQGLILKVWQSITSAFTAYVAQPIGKTWNAVAELLPNTMRKAADFVKSVWTGLVNNVKGLIRSLLQFVVSGINSAGSAVNRLISAFNRLPGADIPLVPMLSVPAFAQGGVVSRPTMAMVGEAGTEYIIPESKMAAASSRYLSGVRGADVVPTSSGTSPVGAASTPVINITTGPVLEFDGERYVKIQDLDRAARQISEGVFSRLRTPAARIALGMA